MPSGRSWPSTCQLTGLGGGAGRGSGWSGGSSRRSCTWTGPGAPGGTCPRTSRRGRPSTPTSPPGATLSPPPRSLTLSPSGPLTPCPKASRGWDNAKKVNGRKRHIAVDATGLLLAVVITAASVQDRDAARPLLWNLHRACRRVRLVWADAGYTGKLAAWAAALTMTVQIVAKRDPRAFQVLRRRW